MASILLPILFYLLLLLFLGLRAWRKKATEEEFLLSNRSLTLPAFVATLVTTWYGGILGVGEFIYDYGVSAWVVFGLPYYVFAALFAFVLAPKIRRSETFSIPDLFYHHYGMGGGLLSSGFLMVMTSPAPYILILAILIEQLLGLSFWISVVTGAFFSVVYVFWGGFRSVVQTDKLQFMLMFASFATLLWFLTQSALPPGTLTQHLDAAHLSPGGGMNWQQLLVWFLIASWTFIDPGFHQRCAAASSGATARRGILISIAFWFVFDMLTLVCGLYAVALYPHADALAIYPQLARDYLPPVLQGLFFTGLLAIVMSTIDSFTFLSGLTFGRDLVWRIHNKTDLNRAVRLGLLVSGVLAVLIIFAIPSVVNMWYALGSLFIPPLLLPLLAAYFPALRISRQATVLAMSSSFAISLAWFLVGKIWLNEGAAFMNVEPFFPGLIWSTAWYMGNRVVRNIRSRI